MRLVLSYSVSDGCTYSCDITLPFEHASKEEAALALLALCEDYAKRADAMVAYVSDDITFAGHKLSAMDFWDHGYDDRDNVKRTYREPVIQTLDEWFAAGLEETK